MAGLSPTRADLGTSAPYALLAIALNRAMDRCRASTECRRTRSPSTRRFGGTLFLGLAILLLSATG